MLKRVLIFLVLALAQIGCSIEEGVGPYRPLELTDEDRSQLEGLKREFLVIEDIKIGDGALAAWGRKVKANIAVRYTDGTIIYEGAITDDVGFAGSVFLYNASQEPGVLSSQIGIRLGLNGMAVGGTRRITVQAKLVEAGPLVKSISGFKGADVRKDTLIVEATLNASCIPVLMRAVSLPTSRHMIEREVGCRDHQDPRRSSKDPVWKVY